MGTQDTRQLCNVAWEDTKGRILGRNGSGDTRPRFERKKERRCTCASHAIKCDDTVELEGGAAVATVRLCRPHCTDMLFQSASLSFSFK